MTKYDEWIGVWLSLNNPEGRCAEATEEMIKAFPELKRIRGHVHHILSPNRSPHWWCLDPDGNIIDPTAVQFIAIIEYIPHDENQPEPTGRCPNCGEYCFDYNSVCSDKCANEYRVYINTTIF